VKQPKVDVHWSGVLRDQAGLFRRILPESKLMTVVITMSVQGPKVRIPTKADSHSD
jgi:hypothetical protein